MQKFITPCVRETYIKGLEEFFEIEYSQDYYHIIQSNKPLLVWNHLAFLVPGNFDENFNNNVKLRYKVWHYYKQNHLESYCIERGGFPNSVYVDSDGFCTESKSYLKWKAHETISNVEGYIKTLIESDITLEEQSNRQEIEYLKKVYKCEDYEKVIFVPLQVHNDITILISSPTSVYNFLTAIYNLSTKNPKWLFLVKSHPLDKFTYEETDNFKNVESLHYKDCISLSESIVCINSGIGLQALAWNKKVYNIGKNYYVHDGLSKITTLEKLEEDIKFGYVPNYDNVKKFYSFLINVFYTSCNTKTFKFLEPIRLIK